MNLISRFRLPLLVLLLTILGALCFTVETTKHESGYSREALFNPWLAAGRVLEKNRLRVRFAPEYTQLPEHARVLVLATPLQYLDRAEQRVLLEWVKQGGHLVAELQDVGGDDDEGSDMLVRELEVRLGEHEFDDKAIEQVRQDLKNPRTLLLANEGTLQARFDPDYFLAPGQRQPQWVARDKYGAHAMRFQMAHGRITVTSDLAWMHNRHLGDDDHAALLWRVVDAQPGDEVWLIHGSERPSLLALIWEQASLFLLALAVGVLAWLWAASRRFGPLQTADNTRSRRLAEHLEAAGRYLLRHGGLQLLFDSSRQRLLGHVQRRHPQWRRLPTAQLAEQLAQRAQIESGAVLRLLETDEPGHILQFAADIRLINRLRKAL
jgi:hypothetical protein